MKNNRLLLIGSISLFILMLCIQIARSIALEGDARHIDLRWIYTAGTCWNQGLSPYNTDHFYAMWERIFHSSIEGRPYVYPPTSALIAMPLALFPWEHAKWIFDTLNILMLLFSLLMIGGLIKKFSPYDFKTPRLWLALAVGASVSMISATIFTGQTPLFALAGCLGALYCALSRRSLSAALFMGLASIKPQLSLIPLLYILLKKPRIFILGAFLISGICGVVFILSFEKNCVENVLNSLSINMSLPENQYGNLTAAYRFFDRFAWHWPRLWILSMGTSLFFLMGALLPRESYKKPEVNLMLIGLTFALTAVFAPLHIYDLSILCVCLSFIMVLEWYWIVAFLPGIVCSARPAIIVKGLSLPWDPNHLLVCLGAPWIMLFTIFYLIRKKN